MPLVNNSSYKKHPWFHFNGFTQTVIPGVFRKVNSPYNQKQRFTLSDGDFIDLFWAKQKSAKHSVSKLMILTHGLEGNAHRQYITGTADYFFNKGWDILAWNCRSCSPEMNKRPRLYHHGEIEDIAELINHVLETQSYPEIYLSGFSMGGSINMKYLGVQGEKLDSRIKASANFSVPCDIKASVDSLELKKNIFFKTLFFSRLKHKIILKEKQFPGIVDIEKFDKVKTWYDMDEWFIAPINGFSSPKEFYEKASCKNFMEGINIPTLLVNAENDPIIPLPCSPIKLCQKHTQIYLERPKKGGHIGFTTPEYKCWMEERIDDFFTKF